jgi:elongation factor 1-gamma
MSQLRIFSYLPNPRIWKATIVARLCGVDLEWRGASPKDLQSWLWDFDARPLSADDQPEANEMRGHSGFQGKLHKTAEAPVWHRAGGVQP